MNANELAEAMELRASIRRKATSRKSVQENANDRLADQLEEAATMLRQQQLEITGLKLEWQVWSDMNLALRDRVAFLESQVYGGTTK